MYKYFFSFFFAQMILSATLLGDSVSNDSLIFLGKSPVKEVLLTILRDRSTNCSDFQDAANILSQLLSFKVGEFVATEKKEVQTLTGATFKDGQQLKKNPILVTVWRSGLSLLPAFQNLFKGASVGMVGIKRNEETAEPMLYYLNFPSIVADDQIIILEPMLATGGSLHLTISLLKERGASEENIIIATVIAAPQGVERLQKEFPKIRIVLAALDPQLNEVNYIVPGLGDFGDRYFGNDSEPDFESMAAG